MLQPQTIEEIKWDTLTNALFSNNCVLFLGPFLPLYRVGNSEVDFNSLAALHLSEELTHKGFEFDHSQSQHLSYIAEKFISFNDNYRPRLEDEISKLYATQVQKISGSSNGNMPSLYSTVLTLPFHTIINMQPDSFFDKALNPDEVFGYYHYKNKGPETNINEEQLLVYNLFGSIIKDKNRYKTDSIILTEDDQVDFVRNLVSGNPHIPDAVISRFNNDKIYIFLDCNLDDWYFRLVMEILKIHKESHSFSLWRNPLFGGSTVEFFKKRYGFVFINNNSEEFINTFKQKYIEAYPIPPRPSKKIFMAYDDSSENFLHSLNEQLEPWVEKKQLLIWSRENILPGEDYITREKEEFDGADAIILLVNARFLSESNVSSYIKPALQVKNTKKVFAVIERACPWDESPLNSLGAQNILPLNRIAVKVQQPENSDGIIYEIAKSITNTLWQ